MGRSTITKSWSEATDEELASIRGVCLDIDETLSTQGKLTAEAFAALWGLKDVGLGVVPITGRPAGWCDHFARFWPVDAVVGENGAFVYFMNEGVRKRIDTPMEFSKEKANSKLKELSFEIQKEFPQASWASDQDYREYDLAVDFCEDVEPWSEEEVLRLRDFCQTKGAHAKVSSIHVNVWFGDYNKKSGFDNWLKEGSPGLKASSIKKEEWIFIGDSPNDEPLFADFKQSVGVANVNRFLGQMQAKPTWITGASSGAGFVEFANRLISLARA